MAFWQKKVLPKQRISCCEGIYSLVMHISGCNHDMSIFRCHSKRMVECNSLSIGYYGYLGQVSIYPVNENCRPPTKLQESNVFRDACLSAVGKGVMVPLYVMAAPPLGQHQSSPDNTIPLRFNKRVVRKIKLQSTYWNVFLFVECIQFDDIIKN